MSLWASGDGGAEDAVMQQRGMMELHSLAHPPSMGLPEPLKTLPIMSLDTGVFNTCRQNTTWYCLQC